MYSDMDLPEVEERDVAIHQLEVRMYKRCSHTSVRGKGCSHHQIEVRDVAIHQLEVRDVAIHQLEVRM